MECEINDIIERLKNSVEKSGMTYVELEKATNIAKSSLQRYVSGTTKKIPIDAIQTIANAIGVSPAYLMGWTNFNKIITLTERENQLISAYRNHPEMQSAVDTLLGITNEPENEMATDMVNTIKQTEKSLSKVSNTKK